MRSYVNITKGSIGEIERQNAFRKGILDKKSNELKNNPNLNLRLDWSGPFNEWHLSDEDDNVTMQDVKNLYVSDWQVISQVKT